MHVHFLDPPEPQMLDHLRSLLDSSISISTGEIKKDDYSATILVAGRPSYRELKLFKELEILIVPWTGIPPETLAAVRKCPGIRLHNLHHNAAPVAELAVALLFAVSKKIVPFDRELRNGNWQMRYLDRESMMLAGKRALIVGYGQIGIRIGMALQAFGIQVEAIKRSPGKAESVAVHSPESLNELLPKTDFLFLALPLTNETEDLIAEPELKSLPSSAILINVSRGGVVKQDALYSALREKEIFGAGLDVWYNYPQDQDSRSKTFPGDFPFQELDNLVLSPHRAGLVSETEILRMQALADLLNAAARNEKLANQVNVKLGY